MSLIFDSSSVEDISTPIHASLNRPILVLGGERKLVLSLATIAGMLIFSIAQIWAAILGLVIWATGHYGLIRAAAYDTQLSQTAVRALRYKKFYPAAATPFAPIREVRS